MAVFAVNILGRSDEPTGRAEVMVAGDEHMLRREFSACLIAASEVTITADPSRVAAQLVASGWAPPEISGGSRPRLYRCTALPDWNAPENVALPA